MRTDFWSNGGVQIKNRINDEDPNFWLNDCAQKKE